MTEISRCPFCDHNFINVVAGAPGWLCKCNKCFARTTYFDSCELAIAAWNTRAASPSEWQPIESADKSKRIIGIWKDGKWQAGELWFDDSIDEWTHTGGDYYCNPQYFVYSPPNNHNRSGDNA